MTSHHQLTMASNKNTNSPDSLQLLRDKMGRPEFRGCYPRTAKALGCTSNWVWKVIHEKVAASTGLTEKIVHAALDVLEAMDKERQQNQAKSKTLDRAITNRLQALGA